jgi:predicted TIM-barrel fold metal-dependent hydrolase
VLIDCDIHVTYRSLQELAPYADVHTRELIETSGTTGLMMPTYPWMHPTGWLRRDTYDAESVESGAMYAGYTLEQLRAQLLDPYDIRFGMINPDEAASFSILPNARLAAGLARAYNDWLLDTWLRHDERLRGAIIVPAQWPEAAAAEIRRVGGDDRFSAVFLPGASRIPYGNPVYDPIWEAASELELPVAVHVHYEGVGISGPLTGAGVPDFYTEFHTLNGASLTGHLVSVLCHGTFERFPRARMLLMEGGLVGYVGALWRLDANWKACRPEIPWCRRRPSEYVWDHVRFSTQPLESPDDPQLLHDVLRALEPERTLCFSSDYAHWDFDAPDRTLRELPAQWREAVGWRNAAELYGLPVEDPAGAR